MASTNAPNARPAGSATATSLDSDSCRLRYLLSDVITSLCSGRQCSWTRRITSGLRDPLAHVHACMARLSAGGRDESAGGGGEHERDVADEDMLGESKHSSSSSWSSS
uniref:Uncharacterized protein n=1 Tax=Arundo donax TaxID=35708 RepID=A0A0A9FGS0_ARUDO